MNLLERLIAAQTARRDQLTALNAQIRSVVDVAEADGQRDLSETETAELVELRERRAALEREIAGAEERIAGLRADTEAEQRAAQMANEYGDPGATRVRVGTEERVYRPDVQERSFFADMFASRFMGHSGAGERLTRHTEQMLEHRNIVTSALAGLVPPQYLVDLFAPVARAGRPFLNSLNVMPLPADGVSFIVPRGTTGAGAAMTAEAAGWNEVDMVNADVTNGVNLVTAQQDISRTLFMRGGSMVDQLIFADLFAASEVALNASALTGNGTAPQHRGVTAVAGISAVTYTDASPTVIEAWPKVSDAVQRINSLRFMPGNVVYMHPRRWGWITSAVDTTGRPLFEFSTNPPNVVMGLGTAAEYGQVVGTLQGLPVVTDASIPTNLGGGTNEDVIIVARSADLMFWEDDLMQFTFEQTLTTAPGEVRLAAGRFSLAIFGRYPTAISTITGTGLIAPTF
jgi:HK97 family phage major capsid protein